MKLKDVLAVYKRSINDVNSFINIAYRQDAAGAYIHTNAEIEFIVTSAYLRMFVAWEEFLEKSFICYLLGKKSLSGTTVKRYVKPLHENHAQQIIIGVNRYVDWANHEIVKRLAENLMEDGRPYKSILSSVQLDLMDMRTVRNSSAHVSSTTQHQLDALASRKLCRVVTGISVSAFITSLDPTSGATTIIQTYQGVLDAAAESIANNII